MQQIKQLFKSRKFLIIAGFLFVVFTVLLLSLGVQNNLPSSDLEPTPTLVPGEDYTIGQIVVKFKDGVTDDEINETLSQYDSKIRSRIEQIGVVVVEVPVGRELEIQEALVDNPIVEYSEPDYVIEEAFVPNDPDLRNQWGIQNIERGFFYEYDGKRVENKGKKGADIHAVDAWDVTKGSGVVIAVLDTGIDSGHPDISGKIVGTKVFITSSVNDKSGHGTHVAGIVAANTNDGRGIAGACPDCKLLIGKVLGDDGKGAWSGLAAGVIWAADQGVKVINMSIKGDSFSNAVADSINYAWGKGVVLVAAAGNEGKSIKGYPAAMDNVVAVGATDNIDDKTLFSNYGSWVDIAAPGAAIYSSVPDGKYGYKNGTSMASPMVAGVAALVWSTQYGTSNRAVVDRLFATADKTQGTGSYWKHGRLNAASAVGGSSQNKLPKGIVDIYSCSRVAGWAYDPDASSESIDVHIYVNGKPGEQGAEGYPIGKTPINRPDVNNAEGITGVHGFDWTLPEKYKDGKSHKVYVYAIDSQGGSNPEIGNGSTGVCVKQPTNSPSPSLSPSVTIVVSPTITIAPPPGVIAPTFVCAGSASNYCGLPVLPSTTVTANPTVSVTGSQISPTISTGLTITLGPSVSPTVTTGPPDQKPINDDANKIIRDIFEQLNEMIKDLNKQFPFLNLPLLPLS